MGITIYNEHSVVAVNTLNATGSLREVSTAAGHGVSVQASTVDCSRAEDSDEHWNKLLLIIQSDFYFECV